MRVDDDQSTAIVRVIELEFFTPLLQAIRMQQAPLARPIHRRIMIPVAPLTQHRRYSVVDNAALNDGNDQVEAIEIICAKVVGRSEIDFANTYK